MTLRVCEICGAKSCPNMLKTKYYCDRCADRLIDYGGQIKYSVKDVLKRVSTEVNFFLKDGTMEK